MHTIGRLAPTFVFLSLLACLLGASLLAAKFGGHVARSWEWCGTVATILIAGGILTFCVSFSIVLEIARAI